MLHGNQGGSFALWNKAFMDKTLFLRVRCGFEHPGKIHLHLIHWSNPSQDRVSSWLELAAQMFLKTWLIPIALEESLTMPHDPNKTFFVKQEGRVRLRSQPSCQSLPVWDPFYSPRGSIKSLAETFASRHPLCQKSDSLFIYIFCYIAAWVQF